MTVLDLGAVFDRDTVKMPDGTVYELRNQQEFGIIDWHHLNSLHKQAQTLMKSAGESEADAAKVAQLTRDAAAMLIVDLQDDAEIPEWACAAVFRFWAAKVEAAAAETPADPPKPRRSTTGASSRGSKRSTAATRKAGSQSRGTR